MSKILAFAGSARKDSFNKRLLAIAVQGARDDGAQVTEIDLGDFPMPLMDQDLERAQGLPEHARRFKQLLIEHDALLIASPEYNSAFSPLLKNAIDWASRAESADEAPLVAYRGKYAAIMAASPGAGGGLRGLVFLRLLLSNIGVTVLANQFAVPQAAAAFSDDGALLDESRHKLALGLGVALHATVARLRSESAS